jgi:hypothetical protein
MRCLFSSLLFLASSIVLALCMPVEHNIQKRATLLETVGDISAGQAGIINDGGEQYLV